MLLCPDGKARTDEQDGSKQVIARFEAERQALALLDHPNIAYVFNAGTTEAERPYFVMEYVKGVPITEHCDREKLSIEERLKSDDNRQNQS